MVLKNAKVIFSKQGSYFPGETLDGKLYFFIRSSKDIKVSKLYLKFNGKAKVFWNEIESSHEIVHTTRYSSTETYFKLKHDLLKLKGGQIFLKPGENFLNFSIPLPSNIPSTFIGRHGEITYNLKVRAKKWWKINYEAEFPIIIGTGIIYRDFPTLQLPLRLFFNKKHTNLFCGSGITNVEVILPKTIYLYGEIIIITVNLKTNSNIAVKDLVLKLKENIVFISSSPCTEKKASTSTIRKVHTGVLPYNISNLNYNIQIPSDVKIADLRNCKIINFKYILCVKVIFSGVTRSLTETIPVLITNRLM